MKLRDVAGATIVGIEQAQVKDYGTGERFTWVDALRLSNGKRLIFMATNYTDRDGLGQDAVVAWVEDH